MSTNPQIHVYINRINDKLVFKIKVRNKLKLKMFRTMKLFDSSKKIIEETKNNES